MIESVPDWGKRQFLLTNLAKREDGQGFRWIINLEAIEENQREIEGSPIGPVDRFEGPALFLMGGKSDYFSEKAIPLIEASFPHANLEIIESSGHNPHFEFREEFVSRIANFFKTLESV